MQDRSTNGKSIKKVDALRIEIDRIHGNLDWDPDNEEIRVEHAVFLDDFTKPYVMKSAS